MDISKLLITLGFGAVLIGLIMKYLPWLLSWFGKLPGDINIQNAHGIVFIPLASMLLISLLISLLFNLFSR